MSEQTSKELKGQIPRPDPVTAHEGQQARAQTASMAQRVSRPVRTRLILRVYDAGVDILRETTEVDTGRVSLVSLGWANLRDASIPDSVRQKMRPEEITAAQDKLLLLRDRMELRDRADAYMLAADINRVRTWLQTASLRDVEKIADDLVFEMQELRALILKRLSERET